MHQVPAMNRMGWLALVLLACAPAAAQGANSDPAVAAVSTVVSFRANWLNDATRFNVCSIRKAVGPRADFPAALSNDARRLLGGVHQPCPREAAEVEPGRYPPEVLVDSLAVGDSVARVYLTVRRGEQVHRENYTLAGWRPGIVWSVGEVRVWGVEREYPAPRRRGGAERPD